MKPELIPMPDVSETVQFFPGRLPPDDPIEASRIACAAVVVALYDKPGEVALLQLGGSGMQYRQGWRYVDQVLYAEHPSAADKNNHIVSNSGTWRFAPGDRYGWHEAYLKRKAEAEVMAAKDREAEKQRDEDQRSMREETRLRMQAKRQRTTV